MKKCPRRRALCSVCTNVDQKRRRANAAPTTIGEIFGLARSACGARFPSWPADLIVRLARGLGGPRGVLLGRHGAPTMVGHGHDRGPLPRFGFLASRAGSAG